MTILLAKDPIAVAIIALVIAIAAMNATGADVSSVLMTKTSNLTLLARTEVISKTCHCHAFPPRMDDPATLSPGIVGDHLDQDARNAVWSGPSSAENNTCITSFVLTLPFMSLSTTTSRCASGNPTGITILPPALS